MKSLLPELITFAYVDPESLRLHGDKSTLATNGISGISTHAPQGEGGGGNGGGDGAKGKGRTAKRKELDDAYEFVSSRPIASTSLSTLPIDNSPSTSRTEQAEDTQGAGVVEEEKREDRVVLQFTFNDGELKSANGVGKVMNRRKFKYVPPLSLSPFLSLQKTKIDKNPDGKNLSNLSHKILSIPILSPPLQSQQKNFPLKLRRNIRLNQ